MHHNFALLQVLTTWFAAAPQPVAAVAAHAAGAAGTDEAGVTAAVAATVAAAAVAVAAVPLRPLGASVALDEADSEVPAAVPANILAAAPTTAAAVSCTAHVSLRRVPHQGRCAGRLRM